MAEAANGETNGETTRRLAVLIDGDNAPPKSLHEILIEVAKHGEILIRRVYGDWTSQQMHGWKEVLHTHAMTPVQQFRYVAGKNSTDAAMIIDAMDILHNRPVEGFCIVSSDSDYTRLATKLREEGKYVLGIGEKKTPMALVSACNQFVYLETLMRTGERPRAKPTSRAKTSASPPPRAGPSAELESVLQQAFESAQGEDGWAHLASLGNQLRVIEPGFDPRDHGARQLLDLVKDVGMFDLRVEKGRGHGAVYVKLKE